MIKEYLTQLKEETGLSLEDIEKKSGVPVSTIRKILSGATVNPQYETVQKIVNALGGTIENFDKRNVDDKLIAAYEARISTERYYARVFMVIAIGALAVLVAFLIADLCISTAGWIIR